MDHRVRSSRPSARKSESFRQVRTKQYLDCFNIVRLLFEYCFLTVHKSGNFFQNTDYSNIVWIVLTNSCSIAVGEFCDFEIIVLHVVLSLLGWCRKLLFFCLRFDQRAKDYLKHLFSRFRSGNLFSARLRAKLHLPPWHETFALDLSARMNKLQSGPLKYGQILTMAEIKFWLLPRQLQFAWLRWSCRDQWHQTCPPFHTWVKRNVTTSWFRLHHVGAQYSSVKIDWVICTVFFQKPKNFRIFFRRVQVRWHGY